jgi:hypothetical protein
MNAVCEQPDDLTAWSEAVVKLGRSKEEHAVTVSRQSTRGIAILIPLITDTPLGRKAKCELPSPVSF